MKAMYCFFLLLIVSAFGCGSFSSADEGDAGSRPDGGPGSSGPGSSSSSSSSSSSGSTSDSGSGSGDSGTDAPASICGNKSREGAEVCDGADLSGQNCTMMAGFNNGTLACKADCTGYDTSLCHPIPPTCNAGAPGSVDYAQGNAGTEIGYLLHYAVNPEFYASALLTGKLFSGVKLPGQLVIAGKDGAAFGLLNGGVSTAKLWYRTTIASLPSSCSGAGIKSQLCLSLAAKSFRCQYSPYLEGGACPVPPVTFTAQTAQGTVNDTTTVGWQVWLVDLTCS